MSSGFCREKHHVCGHQISQLCMSTTYKVVFFTEEKWRGSRKRDPLFREGIFFVVIFAAPFFVSPLQTVSGAALQLALRSPSPNSPACIDSSPVKKNCIASQRLHSDLHAIAYKRCLQPPLNRSNDVVSEHLSSFAGRWRKKESSIVQPACSGKKIIIGGLDWVRYIRGELLHFNPHRLAPPTIER